MGTNQTLLLQLQAYSQLPIRGITSEAPTYFQEYVLNWITLFPSADNQESTFRNLKEMLSDTSEKYQDFQEHFKKFVDQQTKVVKPKCSGVDLCLKMDLRMYLYT